MKITLFVRTYPVTDAPTSFSLLPFPLHQRHTLTRDGSVYDAVNREIMVTVPDGAVIDADRKLLLWRGDKGQIKSTVNEVYELARSHAQGFSTTS